MSARWGPLVLKDPLDIRKIVLNAPLLISGIVNKVTHTQQKTIVTLKLVNIYDQNMDNTTVHFCNVQWQCSEVPYKGELIFASITFKSVQTFPRTPIIRHGRKFSSTHFPRNRVTISEFDDKFSLVMYKKCILCMASHPSVAFEKCGHAFCCEVCFSYLASIQVKIACLICVNNLHFDKTIKLTS